MPSYKAVITQKTQEKSLVTNRPGTLEECVHTAFASGLDTTDATLVKDLQRTALVLTQKKSNKNPQYQNIQPSIGVLQTMENVMDSLRINREQAEAINGLSQEIGNAIVVGVGKNITLEATRKHISLTASKKIISHLVQESPTNYRLSYHVLSYCVMSDDKFYLRTKEGIQEVDSPIEDGVMNQATVHADGSITVSIDGVLTTCLPLFETSARATLDIADLTNRKLELTYTVSSRYKRLTFKMPDQLFKPQADPGQPTLAEYRVLQTYKIMTDLVQKSPSVVSMLDLTTQEALMEIKANLDKLIAEFPLSTKQIKKARQLTYQFEKTVIPQLDLPCKQGIAEHAAKMNEIASNILKLYNELMVDRIDQDQKKFLIERVTPKSIANVDKLSTTDKLHLLHTMNIAVEYRALNEILVKLKELKDLEQDGEGKKALHSYQKAELQRIVNAIDFNKDPILTTDQIQEARHIIHATKRPDPPPLPPREGESRPPRKAPPTIPSKRSDERPDEEQPVTAKKRGRVLDIVRVFEGHKRPLTPPPTLGKGGEKRHRPNEP